MRPGGRCSACLPGTHRWGQMGPEPRLCKGKNGKPISLCHEDRQARGRGQHRALCNTCLTAAGCQGQMLQVYPVHYSQFSPLLAHRCKDVAESPGGCGPSKRPQNSPETATRNSPLWPYQSSLCEWRLELSDGACLGSLTGHA